MESRAPASAHAASPTPVTAPIETPHLVPPSAPASREEEKPGWSLATLRGRLCELQSDGRTPLLSASMSLVRQAQRDGQPVAWVAAGAALFYPPDVAEGGVDLSALPVVRTDDLRRGLRAVDTLLRSGSFGLVVLDLAHHGPIPMAVQTRLSGLVRHHQALLLVLRRRSARDREEASLVSLRAEGSIHREKSHRFRVHLDITKDKRHGPGWSHEEICRGPDGLC